MPIRIRCRLCHTESDVPVARLGTVVTCSACGGRAVASPVGAPERRRLGRALVWWFEGDPTLAAPSLLAAVQRATHAWRTQVVPARLRGAMEGQPDIVVFGRRHVAIRDALLLRVAASPTTRTVMLSPDPADQERAANVLPIDRFLQVPVSSVRLVSTVGRLASPSGSAARFQVGSR